MPEPRPGEGRQGVSPEDAVRMAEVSHLQINDPESHTVWFLGLVRVYDTESPSGLPWTPHPQMDHSRTRPGLFPNCRLVTTMLTHHLPLHPHCPCPLRPPQSAWTPQLYSLPPASPARPPAARAPSNPHL